MFLDKLSVALAPSETFVLNCGAKLLTFCELHKKALFCALVT